ncbi:DM13 domain-containing protein [Dactylosporangium sp. AC04546]|uniref:DM13 domain-containing protein n=1 Tax=Dactylosporangium sp. AC04546 TaxID=2862460 RepID=UPI001EDD2256|nr:DM13 domain-containing protein [Dactylosporangium sp. AC04546]WVK83315.1 DM13 domain-containing protein [Dactylosporangium sp. AC04546]
MRRRALIGTAVVLAVVLAFGLYWFAPWRLLTNTTIDDALTSVPATSEAPSRPTSGAASGAASGATGTAAAEAVLVAEGAFVTHEHRTSGTARIIRLPDGTHRLEIAGLDTSDGPDLRVWLTDQPVTEGRDGWTVFDDGQWLELGKLKGNRGDQTYAIPASADVQRYKSVSIWCKRFAVSFGAAPLAT